MFGTGFGTRLCLWVAGTAERERCVGKRFFDVWETENHMAFLHLPCMGNTVKSEAAGEILKNKIFFFITFAEILSSKNETYPKCILELIVCHPAGKGGGLQQTGGGFRGPVLPGRGAMFLENAHFPILKIEGIISWTRIHCGRVQIEGEVRRNEETHERIGRD
jgi:hypothetical protein